MKNYYRLMLGKGSKYAEECFSGNFIGADFDIRQDLTNHLPDEWRAFNKEFIPIFLENSPEKTRIAAGLACGALWTICKGMNEGDVLLCPDGSGQYRAAEVSGSYVYRPDEILPHRRPVKWLDHVVSRSEMSTSLRNSSSSIGTVSSITKYAEEIEKLLAGAAPPVIVSTDEAVEDPVTFALELHLEDFLVQNWASTELGSEFDIYEEDGQRVGQQFPTDTGPMDILAVSKDRNTLLVVELKRGRASDQVVGQLLRYMGYVKDELAEVHQDVRGVIIAHEDDARIKRALSMVPNIGFFKYAVNFRLLKA